ncbi:MAG TPA: MGMT family protein [Candidatus Sulfotelmatobacter sp.]|nr:MGMT family protein [Candidatus Sulfotelmatobacter sp.]
MNSFDKVYKIVATIPKGKILTYKEVSILANVNNPRIVGYALHSNKNPKEIPCHRVIKANGKIADGYAFGGKHIQIEMLKNEGVEFLDSETVNLKASLYKFTS